MDRPYWRAELGRRRSSSSSSSRCVRQFYNTCAEMERHVGGREIIFSQYMKSFSAYQSLFVPRGKRAAVLPASPTAEGAFAHGRSRSGKRISPRCVCVCHAPDLGAVPSQQCRVSNSSSWREETHARVADETAET
eukprot:4540855-Prymnesium_polylepis.1